MKHTSADAAQRSGDADVYAHGRCATYCMADLLPPVTNGYTFVRHLHSAQTHDTFLARSTHCNIDDSDDISNTDCMSRDVKGSIGCQADAHVVIRIYSKELLRRDEVLRCMMEKDVLLRRHVDHEYVVPYYRSFVSKSDLYTVEAYCHKGSLHNVLFRRTFDAEAATIDDAYVMDSHARLDRRAALVRGVQTRPVNHAIVENSLNATLSTQPVTHRVTEWTVKKWMRQLLHTLRYLHETCRVAHLNITLENLFIDKDNNLLLSKFTEAVLTDRAALPCSSSLGNSHDRRSRPYALSTTGEKRSYVNRSMVDVNDVATVHSNMGEPPSEWSDDLEEDRLKDRRFFYPFLDNELDVRSAAMCDLEFADVWAAGIVLFVLLTNTHPLMQHLQSGNKTGAGISLLTLVKSMDVILTENASFIAMNNPHAQDLTRNMLRADPRARLNATEALDHVYLRE